MAKTLKEFLEDRAGNDLRALRALQGASESFVEGKKYGVWCVAHQKGMHPVIEVPREVIGNAWKVAIASAGEAAKTIERTQPNIKAAYPTYPWIALKRLRDAYAHSTRRFLDNAPAESLQEHWNKLYEYYYTTPQQDRFSGYEPVLEEIAAGWSQAQLLIQLARASKDGSAINITNNPILEPVAKFAPNTIKALPIIVAHYNQRHCLMGMGDAIDYTSLFFREAQDLPVDPKPILGVRNRAAHFIDPPNHRRKEGDPNIWEEMLRMEPQIKTIAQSLHTIPRTSQIQASADWRSHITAIYYDAIKRNNNLDPQKEAVLDRAVQFITKSSKNPRQLQDAFILATATMLSTVPVPQAQTIMDYVFAKEGAIRDPIKMKASIAGLSHVEQVKTRQLLDDVARLSQPIGEGIGRNV